MGWFEDNAAALREAGIEESAAKDFIERNPGDYARVITALTNDTSDREFDSQSDNYDQKTNKLSAKGVAALKARGYTDAQIARSNYDTTTPSARWRYVPGTTARPAATGDPRSFLSQGQFKAPVADYSSREARLKQLYQQFLGRDPGDDEIAAQLANYRGDDFDKTFLNTFMSSPEFQQSQPQKIVELYRKHLGRDPTPEEVNSHATNPAGIAGAEYAITQSSEYINRIQQEVFDEKGQLKPGWSHTATGWEFKPQTGVAGSGGRWEKVPGTTGTTGTTGGGNTGGVAGLTGIGGMYFDPDTGGWFANGFGDLPPAITPFTEKFVAPTHAPYATWNQTFTAPEMPNFEAWNRSFVAPTETDMLQEPGYKARMDEGRRQLEAAASARGVLGTGGTLESLMRLGQDYASNEYGNIYNRRFGEYGQDFNVFNTNRQFDLAKTMQDFSRALQTYGTNYNTFASERGFKQGADDTEYAKALGEYQQRFDIDRANQGDFYNSTRQNWMDLWNTSMQNRQQNEVERTNQFGMLNTLTNDYYNRLFRLADYGVSGSAGIAGSGGNISDLFTQIGNANAAGRVGSANAWGNAFSNVGNGIMDQLQLSQILRRSSYPTNTRG